MASRSSKHYPVARTRLHFQLCSVSSVNITAHRPPRPTEKASWISSQSRPPGCLMWHARTCPRCPSRHMNTLPRVACGVATLLGAFLLHGAAVSFCLVLGVSHAYCPLGWPRNFANNLPEFENGPTLDGMYACCDEFMQRYEGICGNYLVMNMYILEPH